jgi:hypothetical protein
MSITEIPTSELQDDLAETLGDIQVCELALLHGIETYGTGKSVQYRLNTNCLIRDQIREELARRGVASAQS